MAVPVRTHPSRLGPRPVLLATAGAVLGFGLLVVEAALVLQLRSRFEALARVETVVADARTEAVRAAAQAEAAARLAVETDGLEFWHLRFGSLSANLDEAIKRLDELSADIRERDAVASAASAAQRAGATRREAIQLAQNGRVIEGRALLASGPHALASERLARAFDAHARATEARIGRELRAVNQQVAGVLLLCGVSLVFLIAAWWGLVGAVRDQIRALGDAADEAVLKAAIVETSADAIVTMDQRRRILELNPAAERLLGIARHEAVGRPARALLGVSPEVMSMLDAGPAGGAAAARRHEIEIEPESDESRGGPIPVEVVVTGAALGQGVIVRTMIFSDLRAKRAEERRRRQLEERLRQSQKLEALGVLAGGVAHDFGNLLTAITAGADRAKAALPPEHAAAEAIGELEATAREAGGMTRSLLAFSRKGIAERRTIDFAALLAETLRLVDRLTPANVRIDFDRPGDGAVWVLADPTQMQQVVINLIVNASDAMPQGGRVGVRLSSGQRPGGGAERGPASPGVLLEVTDQGGGVPVELRERIFEPFFTTKTTGHSVGLGLSVTHGIVVDHGGVIEAGASADPDHTGARFLIWLPATSAPEADNAARRGPSARIGLVERDAFVRELIGSALERAGHEVYLAATDDALERSPPLDLIVADAPESMRTRTGAEGAGPPVLWLVESDAGETPHADRWTLEKPFQMGELIERVAELLRSVGPEPEAGEAGSDTP